MNLAKRALVTLLIAFARQYQVPGVGVNRESPDTVVMGAFKKVARRVHPDKGGSTADSAKLNSARNKWEEASAATTVLFTKDRNYVFYAQVVSRDGFLEP